MWWNSPQRKRRKHGRTLSDNTKRRKSASCKTATSLRPPNRQPKFNNPYSTFDYETENTHTAGSRTFEQAATEIERHTKRHTLSAIASSIMQSRERTARTSAPSADIRGRATTTLQTPFADVSAHIAVCSWKRCAPERVFSARMNTSPLSPPASSIK